MPNPPDSEVAKNDMLMHEPFMAECIKLAIKASENEEVPVGCVVVSNNQIIASASNAQIGNCDPTAHAEVIALRKAALATENYRLPGCTLYSTVEPCLMCAGAILHARVDCVVYGATEPRAGAATGEVDYFASMSHIHKLDVIGGVLEQECRQLIQQFFRQRRNKK